MQPSPPNSSIASPSEQRVVLRYVQGKACVVPLRYTHDVRRSDT